MSRLKLRNTLALLLSMMIPKNAVSWRRPGKSRLLPRNSRSAAEVIALARHPGRPRSRDYIERLFPAFIELHGDRCYRNDPSVVGGVAEFQGRPVMVIAQQGGTMPFPEGFRKARRLMLLAKKCRLPVITLVDTPGAFPGLEAEHRGAAMAIAESLATLAMVDVPVLNIVIGEGGSGGALALGMADVILMHENAVYEVISPEGAAAILYQDASRSAELLPALKFRAPDLLALEVIDDIVPEPPGGAHLDPDAAALLLRDKIVYHLSSVLGMNPKKLVRRRLERFRSIGKFEAGWMRQLRSLFERVRRDPAR